MGKLNFIKTEDYDSLSQAGAKILISALKQKPNTLLCIATGSSPLGTYQIFAQRVKEEKIDVSALRVIKLDEWLGIDPRNPASCESYIREHILEPLEIDEERYIGFASNSKDLFEECKRIDDYLDRNGPIDVCILGLGKNGHLGLNEPNEFLSPISHVIDLDEKTKTHSMLNLAGQAVTKGITLGLGTLLASKQIIFLVTGDEKSIAFEKFREGRVRTDLPASMLWLHQNTACIYNLV
jgi:galactosamine-6-phosphate isomerase